MVGRGLGPCLMIGYFFPQSTLWGILLAAEQLKTSGDVKQTWSHPGDQHPICSGGELSDISLPQNTHSCSVCSLSVPGWHMYPQRLSRHGPTSHCYSGAQRLLAWAHHCELQDTDEN